MTTTLLLRINKFNTVIRAFISKYQSSVWLGTIFGPESVRKWSCLRVRLASQMQVRGFEVIFRNACNTFQDLIGLNWNWNGFSIIWAFAERKSFFGFIKSPVYERYFIQGSPSANQSWQISGGTFPTGLPDGEIMFENPTERPDRTDTYFFVEYWSVLGVLVVSKYLYTQGRLVGNEIWTTLKRS